MVNHESRAWRVLGRSGAWVMGLAVLACAPGDANRGGDTMAVATSTGGVAATPSATADTAQSATATGTDTAAAGQTQTTADTAPQQTAAAPADTLRDTATTKPPTPQTAAQRQKAGAVAAKRAAKSNMAATSTTSTATTDTATTASAAASAETATTQAAATSDTDSVTQGSAAGQVTSEQATAAGQTGAQQPGGDKLLVSQEVYNGWKTFNANCNRCHGDDAVAAAGGIAPDLRQSIEQGRVNHKVYQDVVINGRIQKGMPPWKDLLTEQQVEDIWQYLEARTKGGLPPGRPKRKEG